MSTDRFDRTRRTLIAGAVAGALGTALPHAARASVITRPIPVSGEAVPVIGLGTWQAYDVGERGSDHDEARAGLAAFVDGGGRVIDSSPMYGRAEAAVGALVEAGGWRERVFLATKIWTRGEEDGIASLQNSQRLMRAPVLDLVQVHNLLGIEAHLRTLRRARDQGTVRYLGITHYHAGAHADLERWLAREPLDAVQLNYSLAEPEADARLLALAAEKRVAVLVNRPFAEGAMFRRVAGKRLPAWAIERGVTTWAQYFLKWILGHAVVTCVLTGTRKPAHLTDNLGAASGWLPDAGERRRMQKEFAAM
jgi:diketogulonate reductase-like aldo/keto reductase